MIRWDLVEGKVESSPETMSPVPNERLDLKPHWWCAYLGSGAPAQTLWGPSEAWVGELELKTAESQTPLTCLLTSRHLE